MADNERQTTESSRKRREQQDRSAQIGGMRGSPRSARAMLAPGMVLWVLGGVLWVAAGRLAFALGPDASRWYPLLALLGLLALSALSTLPRALSLPLKRLFDAVLSISPITASIVGAVVEYARTLEPIGIVSGAVAGALLALAVQFTGRFAAVLIEGRAARAAGRNVNPLRASWWGMAVSVAVAGALVYLVTRYAETITGPVPFTGASLVVSSGLIFARFMRNIRQTTAAVRKARQQGQGPKR